MSGEQIRDIAAEYGLTQFTLYVIFAGVITWLAIIISIEYAVFPINQVAINQEAVSRFNQTTHATEYQQYIAQRVFIEQFLRFAGLGITYGAIPLVVSYVFTANHPERRLVPPLLIQIVAFSLLIPYGVFRFLGAQVGNLWLIVFGGMLVLVFSFIYQDTIMIWLLGRFVNRNHLETRVLKVEGFQIDQLEDRLLRRGMRNTLHLRRQPERGENRTLLRSRITADFTTYIELREDVNAGSTVLSSHQTQGSITMSLVFFETGRYFTKTSEELEEYAERTVAHLMRRLTSMDTILTDISDEQYPESLVETATTDLLGFARQSGRMTRNQRLRMFVFLAAFLVPLIYYLSNLQKGVTAELYGLIAAAIGIYATALTLDASVTIRNRRRANE